MKSYVALFILSLALYSCSAFPEFCQSVESIANDDAITIKCDRDCFKQDHNVTINVQISKPSWLGQRKKFLFSLFVLGGL